MTTDIKELVKRLRERAVLAATEGNMTATCDARYFAQSADALEAMAGEVGALKQAVEAEKDEQARMEFHHIHALADLAAERDRLKAALDKARLFIVDQYASDEDADKGEWLAREARPIHAAICKALGGDAS